MSEKINVVCDTEIYPNYFLVVFKRIDTGQTVYSEMLGDNEKLTDLQIKQIDATLRKYTFIMFNGLNYDIPILLAALKGYTTSQLYDLSVEIVNTNQPGWAICKAKQLLLPIAYSHIDLMPISPGIAGLKTYGGRLHADKLQDLPYAFDTKLTEGQAYEVRKYCENDTDLTIKLYERLKPQIELREKIGVEYGTDLRSKSDAQIAGIILNKKLGIEGKPKFNVEKNFKYKAPKTIRTNDKDLLKIIDSIEDAEFNIDKKDVLIIPNIIKTLSYTSKFGIKFQMGIGGIHDLSKNQSFYAGKN